MGWEEIGAPAEDWSEIGASPEELAARKKRPGFIREVARQVGDAITHHVPAAIASTIEGEKPFSATEPRNFLDTLVERGRTKSKERAAEGGESDPLLGGLITRSDVRDNLGPSLGFSAAGMGAGVLAGIPAGIAGTAVGGLAGGAIAGYGAGGAANYAAMQRSMANQFLRDARDKEDAIAVKARGTPLTDQEWVTGYEPKYIENARASGHWEAGPEVASNVAQLALLSTPIGRIIKPLANKGLLTRGAAKLGGMTLAEVPSEALTNIKQQPLQVESGLQEGPAYKTDSASDWWKATKDILAPTLIQTALMGGAGAVAVKAHSYLTDRDIAKDILDRAVSGDLPMPTAPPAVVPGAPPSPDAVQAAAGAPVEPVVPVLETETGRITPAGKRQREAEKKARGAEFRDLMLSEQEDLARRKADIEVKTVAAQQAFLDQAEAERASAQETLDRTIEGNRQRQSETGRFAVLDGILADEAIVNPVEAFKAELGRQGYQDTTPTEQEVAHVERFQGIKEAIAKDMIEPSTPNEMPENLIPAAGEKLTRAQRRAALRAPVDEAAHVAATSPTNELPEPTDGQKDAGNYQKGHAVVGGMDISVENPAGSKRRPEWPPLSAHYGYVKGVAARAPDKEHVDVFIKPGTPTDFAGEVYVVDQNKADGSFDEPKTVIGAASIKEARSLYLANYKKGWEKRVRQITPLTMAEYKTRLQDPKAFLQPQGGQHAVQIEGAAKSSIQRGTGPGNEEKGVGVGARNAEPVGVAGAREAAAEPGAGRGEQGPKVKKAALIPTRAGIKVVPLDESGEPVAGKAHMAGEKPIAAADAGKVSADDFAAMIDEVQGERTKEAEAAPALTDLSTAEAAAVRNLVETVRDPAEIDAALAKAAKDADDATKGKPPAAFTAAVITNLNEVTNETQHTSQDEAVLQPEEGGGAVPEVAVRAEPEKGAVPAAEGTGEPAAVSDAKLEAAFQEGIKNTEEHGKVNFEKPDYADLLQTYHQILRALLGRDTNIPSQGVSQYFGTQAMFQGPLTVENLRTNFNRYVEWLTSQVEKRSAGIDERYYGGEFPYERNISKFNKAASELRRSYEETIEAAEAMNPDSPIVAELRDAVESKADGWETEAAALRLQMEQEQEEKAIAEQAAGEAKIQPFNPEPQPLQKKALGLSKSSANWLMARRGDEDWYTNGHVLINKPPIKNVNEFFGDRYKEERKDWARADQILDRFKGKQTEVQPIAELYEKQFTAVLFDVNGTVAGIDRKYYDLIKKLYPEAQFVIRKSSDDKTAIEVMVSKDVVGVVMPIRTEIERDVAQVKALLASRTEPQPAPEKATPVTPSKVGDEVRIMGVDSVVARTETIGGVRYDLFNGSKLKEDRAAIRVADGDTGNVVSIKQYPTFDAAEKDFNDTVAKANAMEAAPEQAKAGEGTEGMRRSVAGGVKVEVGDLSRAVLSRMDMRLKALGYDSRGSDDVRTMLNTRIAPDGVITHPDWIAAYETAVKGAQSTRERVDAKRAERGLSANVDFARMRELGLTDDWREAGYITPRGALIDLSGKREGGERGTRSYDHREAGGTTGMQEYMALGHIRIDSNAKTLDISREPTPEQYKRISEFAENSGGEITLDLENGLGELRGDYYSKPDRTFSREYPVDTKSSRILADIRRFYFGEEPTALPVGRSIGADQGPYHTPETLRTDLAEALNARSKGLGDAILAMPNVDVVWLENAPEGEKRAGTTAFVTPDGRVTFIADMIPTAWGPEQLVGLATHEIAVHAVRMNKSDAEWNQIIQSLRKMRAGGVEAVQEAYKKAEQAGTSSALMDEEGLGYLVAMNPNLPIVKRFIAWVRKMIRSLARSLPGLKGLPIVKWADSLTVDDLHAMAADALRAAPKIAERNGEKLDAMREEAKFSKQDQTQTPTRQEVHAAMLAWREAVKKGDQKATDEAFSKWRDLRHREQGIGESSAALIQDQTQTNPDIRRSVGESPITTQARLQNVAFDSAKVQWQDFVKSDRTLSHVYKVNTPFHLAEANWKDGTPIYPGFKPVYEEGQAANYTVARLANEAADLAKDLMPRIETVKDALPEWLGGTKQNSLNREGVEKLSDALMAGTLSGGGNPLEGRKWTNAELKSGITESKEGAIEGLQLGFRPLNDTEIGVYHQALDSAAYSLEEHSKGILWRLADQKKIALDGAMSLEEMAGTAVEEAQDRVGILRTQQEDVAERIKGAQGEDLTRARTELGRIDRKIQELDGFADQVKDIEKKTNGLIDRGYFPALRFGEHFVNATDMKQDEDGNVIRTERHFSRHENQTQANIAKREVQRLYPEAMVTSGIMPMEASKLFQGLNLDALELFAEHLVDDQGNPISKDPLMQQYFRLAVQERSSLHREQHRKGIPGYSKDVPRVMSQFTTSMASSTARHYHASKMMAAVKNIRAGDLQDYATRYVKYLQDPKEEASLVRSVLANYYILGSIAFGAVNSVQPVLMTAPYLTQYTSWASAMKHLGTASLDIVRGKKTWTADERAAYERASKEGTVSPQELHQITAHGRAQMLGDSPLWQKLEAFANSIGMGLPGKMALRKVQFMWGSIYALTEQFNRGTTFLAAYRLAKELKKSDPYAFAKEAVDTTQVVYCVDTDTEILTAAGWKRHNQLHIGDSVYAVDGEGCVVEDNIHDVHVFPGSHEITEFRNGNGLSIVVTDDHRNVIQNYSSRDKKWQSIRYVKTSDLKGCNFFLRAPLGSSMKRVARYTDDQVRLLAWVAAEGSFFAHRGCKIKRGVVIVQSQSHNPEYVNEIQDLLIRLGGHFNRTEHSPAKRGDWMIAWTLRKPLWSFIGAELPGKRVTMELLSKLTVPQMAMFLHTFGKGDGHFPLEGGMTISQKSIETLHTLQAMAVLSGQSSTVYERVGTHDFGALYVAKNSKRAYVKEFTTTRKTVDTVWCPQTAQGTWIARRNGRTFITGNSKANRPEWARGPIGSVVMTFKQFNISYIELAKRLYTTDKKAFGILMLHLFVLAGAAGLPFAEDIEDILDTIGQWMGYDTNTRASLRKAVAGMVGEDIGDFLLHGVSAIPGMPIDVSVRMGFQNLIPGTAMLKVSEPDATRDILELLGPAGTLVKNLKTAVQEAGMGRFDKAKLLAPLAIQNVLKGADMWATDEYKDMKGRKVIDVDKVDSMFKMIGLQPSSVARQTRLAGEVYQDIALARAVETAIADKIAQSINEDKPELREEAFAELQRWNERNVDMPIRINRAQILRRVQEMRSTRESRVIKSAPREMRGAVAQQLTP